MNTGSRWWLCGFIEIALNILKQTWDTNSCAEKQYGKLELERHLAATDGVM